MEEKDRTWIIDIEMKLLRRTAKETRMDHERNEHVMKKVKVNLFLCFFLTEHDAMKAYWGKDV
jgi:hypothetical protein